MEHISVSEAEDLEDKSVDSDSEKAGNKKQEVPPKDQGSKRWRLSFAQCHALLVSMVGTVSMFLHSSPSRLMLVGLHYCLEGRALQVLSSSLGPRKRDVEPKRVMSSVVERAKPSGQCKGKSTSCSIYEARGPEMQNPPYQDAQ